MQAQMVTLDTMAAAQQLQVSVQALIAAIGAVGVPFIAAIFWLGNLSGRVKDLTQRVEDSEQQVDKMQTQIAELQVSTAQIDQRLVDQSKQIDELKRDLGGRIDRQGAQMEKGIDKILEVVQQKAN